MYCCGAMVRKRPELRRMNPEETIMRLIRQGIPKENISAKFKYLTASLPNADYRIYRETSGYPADTIRVTRNGCSVYISSGLTTEDTARFVLLLDGHLPEIDEAAETLFGELQRLLREKQKEMMEYVKQCSCYFYWKNLPDEDKMF